MSSTLPRSRSLSSGASSVSSPSLAISNRERVRPVSLCEASWGRVLPPQQPRGLQRTPSQANNLSTTVPCSLVSKTLGGRHTPTRSSLKHSRMVVRKKKTVLPPNRRWSAVNSPSGLGRVGALVLTAQTVVGLLMGALAGWCLVWAPSSIDQREVPHYPAVPLFLSGVLGCFLILCCSNRRNKSSANIVKGLIVLFSTVAIVACLCVCVLTALHLISLAPMRCREHRDLVVHDPQSDSKNQSQAPHYFDREPASSSVYQSPEDSEPFSVNFGIDEGLSNYSSGDGPELIYSNRIKSKRDETHVDEEIESEDLFEGSGGGEILANYHKLGDVPSDIQPPNFTASIHVEVIYCVCESWNDHWKRTFKYPDLRCLEVNRVLPVLSVAICIVTAGGAVLSGVVLYLLWASKESFYDPVRPSEIRPIVFSSNLKRNNSVQSKINGGPYWNGSNGVRNGSLYV